MNAADQSIDLWIKVYEEAERRQIIEERTILIDASGVWRFLVEQSDPKRIRSEIDGLLRSSAARIAQ